MRVGCPSLTPANAAVLEALQRTPLDELARNARVHLKAAGVAQLADQLRWEAVIWAAAASKSICETAPRAPALPDTSAVRSVHGVMSPLRGDGRQQPELTTAPGSSAACETPASPAPRTEAAQRPRAALRPIQAPLDQARGATISTAAPQQPHNVWHASADAPIQPRPCNAPASATNAAGQAPPAAPQAPGQAPTADVQPITPALLQRWLAYEPPPTGRAGVSRSQAVPELPFAVDTFNKAAQASGLRHFFLTHFHADHYQGLGRGFGGTLYCTPETAKLVQLKLGVRYTFSRSTLSRTHM